MTGSISELFANEEMFRVEHYVNYGISLRYSQNDKELVSFGVGEAPKFWQLQNCPVASLCGAKSGDPQFCRPIAYPPKRGRSRVNVGRLARLVTVEVEAIRACAGF